MQIGGVNDFKGGGDINLCLYIRALCYTKRGGSGKNGLHKGKGQENLNMASLHLHQPSNNDPSLSVINSAYTLFE